MAFLAASISAQDIPKLTARQQQVLSLIEQSIEESGYPPTRAEIAAKLGFRSVNAAEEHIQALARKGAIDITPGASRGLRLLARKAPESASRKPDRAERAAYQPALPLSSLAQLALPLVGRVAAGAPILATEHIESTYSVDSSFFAKRPDFLLTVRGMSMRDAGILDGDLLAVQSAQDATNGQIVVARLDDEVTVKRFKRTGSQIALLPENPDFKPIVVDPSSPDFSIEGIAVGLIRGRPL